MYELEGVVMWLCDDVTDEKGGLFWSVDKNLGTQDARVPVRKGSV